MNSLFKTPGIITLLCLVNLTVFAHEIKLGIIDTGFCSLDAFDATKSNVSKCDTSNPKNFRNHGEWIISNIVKEKVKIFPVIVFNKDGKTKDIYWRNALEYLYKKNVDIVLMASALPFASKKESSLRLKEETLHLISSGQKNRFINEKTKLWPQHIAPQKNLILVGTYLTDGEDETPLDNPQLLYKEKTNFFVKEESRAMLKGTSLAVTKLFNYIQKNCAIKEVVKCLKNNSQLKNLWPKKSKKRVLNI